MACAWRLAGRAPPGLSGPPHALSGVSLVQSGTPGSASSHATQFGRPMRRCARRAAHNAPRTAPCAWNARTLQSGTPLTTPDARLAAGDAPGVVTDGPLKLGGAWMPASGARHKVACARGSAAPHPQAECGRRSNSGGPQGVWLGAQAVLLGAPSSVTSRAKTFGLPAAF